MFGGGKDAGAGGNFGNEGFGKGPGPSGGGFGGDGGGRSGPSMPGRYPGEKPGEYRRRIASERLNAQLAACLLYTSPSPRDGLLSRMPASA